MRGLLVDQQALRALGAASHWTAKESSSSSGKQRQLERAIMRGGGSNSKKRLKRNATSKGEERSDCIGARERMRLGTGARHMLRQ